MMCRNRKRRVELPRFGRNEATCGRSESDICRTEPAVGRIEPVCGQTRPKFGRTQRKFGRAHAKLRRTHPAYGRCRLTLGPTQPSIMQTQLRFRHALGRTQSKFGRYRPAAKSEAERPTRRRVQRLPCIAAPSARKIPIETTHSFLKYKGKSEPKRADPSQPNMAPKRTL